MNSGIYQIRNIINNKIYVGSSSNLNRRKDNHFKSLIKGNHHSKYLQNSFNKYGVINFVFEILAKAPKERIYLLKLEQFFLNNLKPTYNMTLTAGSQLGTKHTVYAKLKMRQKKLGIPKSKSHIQLLAQTRYKPIQQICPLTCNIIAEYDSVKEAANMLKVDKGDITKVAKGVRKTVGGFVWRYK